MNQVEIIENRINQLLSQDNPSLAELRHMMLDVDDLVTSSEYQGMPIDERSRLQSARKDLKNRIRKLEDEQEEQLGAASQADAATVESDLLGDKVFSPVDAGKTDEATHHSRLAEEQMEAAEKLFYSGRYAEAIKLFDQVLEIEPDWERAHQHRVESENYMRTGYIPAVALPADAASAFGKAQSAARVGRYADAMILLNKAQSVLRELGIQRWQEGQEFEQKLQENIDAENAYQDGLKAFRLGQIDEAIEAVETAQRATGLPKYADRALAMRKFKDTLRSINETLSTPGAEPRQLVQAKADLDLLSSEYAENPALERLLSRFEGAIPSIVNPLKEQARDLKAQAERSATIEETLFLARQARHELDQIKALEGVDESLERLNEEVDKLIRQVQKNADELENARAAYEANQSWPAEAYRISADVRRRFPHDPNVIALKRALLPHQAARLGIRMLIAIGILGILALFTWWGSGRYQAYQLAQTPSPTGTATHTPTATVTSTRTSTATSTITPTATHTMTPTPASGTALRPIWARNGCYESFKAIGKIPEGGVVLFLPAGRRFDDFNRECILVEYSKPEGGAIIGWVLIADLGGIN